MAFDPSTASVVEDDFDPTSAQLVEDAPVKKRTWIEAAQDGGRSFGSSVNNTLKTIADLGGTNNPVSQFLDENAKTWQGNYSPSYKAELEKQKEEKAALGADPSYASRAALAARQTIRNPIEGIGEVAGNIAPMVIGGLAGLGAKGMIGLSAAMGGGAVKGGIAETVQNALDSDLMNDPLYADMRSGGMSEKDAKSSLSEQRASYGDAYGKILLGAGIGAAVGKFGSVESAITNMGKGAAGQGLLKSIGKEVATEIPQEMTETYLGNIGAAAKGAKIAADQGVVEAGVKAGILSAVGGAGAGFGTAKPADILQSTDVDSAISTFEQSTAPTATSLMDSMRGIGQAWQDLGVQPSGEVSNIAARQAGQEWQGIAQDQTGSLEQQRLDMEREGAALGQARDARLAEVGRQWQDLGITQPQDDLQAQRMGMRSGSLLEQQAAPLISQDVQAAQQLLQDQNGSTPSVLPSDSGSVGQEIAVPTQGMGDGIETGRPSGLQPGGLQDNSLDQSGKPSGEVPASAVIPTFNAQPTTLGTQTNAVAGQGSLDQRLTPVSQRNVQGQQEQPATVDAPVAGDATQATQLPRTGSASVQTDGIDRLRENVESSEPFSDNHIASIKALKQAVTQDANDSLSAGDAPVYVSKSGTTSVITPSAQKPGMYQVTRYNKTGAIGDSQYNSLKQAIDDNQLEDMPRMPKAEAVKHMASLVEAESKYQESKQVDQRLPPVSQRTESTNAQAPKKVSRANIPNDQKPDATEEQVTSVNEAEYQKSIKESIQARLGLVKPKQEEDERKTPFKAFLRKHGINSKYTSDIAGENRLKANNMLPATFRNNGLGLDALIERAIESGFVQERDRGDQDKFISMIQREIAGEKQVSSDVVNDDAEAQYERVQRMEIEELADRIGLPYSNDISTDKLASMVYRVERIKKQGAKTGTLKADRVKANALEIVARVEKKRAEYERQEAVFAQLTIAEQDASLDILTDEDGNPVIVRQAEIQAESAWAESQQEWNEQNGQTYTPEYPAAQQDQTPTAGIAEESSGRATQVGTQEQRRGNEAQDAGQAGSEGLTATTPEQVKADEQRREQAERAAKAQKKAKDLADKREQDRKDIAARSVGAADSFELGQDPLQSLTGQGSVFDMPDEPEAQTPVDRFEIGKSLTKEQRKSVIATLVDVYKSKGAPRESKGQGRDGNERSGYAHSPELFEKSDITGAMVRYYVTLPDGRMAHPSELFPDYTQNDINNEIERRANAENRNREIAKSQYLADTFDTKRDAAVFWNNLSDKSVKTASGKPTVYDAMDRTHITDGKKFAMIPTDVLKNQDMMDAIKAEGWTVAEAKPAEQATETLDAANVTGQERVTAMIAVNRGDLTPEQLAAAYPAKIDDAKPDNSVKPEAKDGNSIPTPEFKYTPASKIDTPAQGVLANAKEQKDQAFARLKKLRQQVRDGRSELRLELIKAESAHKDALRYVSEAQDQIERDANKQGLTTIKPVQESRGTTQNPTTVAALQSAIRDLVGAFGGNKLGRIVAATAAEIKENWEPLIGKSVQESQGGRSADDNSMGDPKAINGIPVLNGSMPDYFSDPQKFLDDIISSFGDSGNAIGLRGIYEDELGVLEIPNSHDNRADADNSELEGVSTYGVISDLSYDPDSVLKLFKEYGNSALDFGDTPYIAVIEGRPSIDDIANDPGEMVMRDAKTIAYIRRKTNESTTPSSGGAKYSKAALQTDTPEFKKWFGDWENNPESASKVVDENGEPLVVYHGTAKDFDAFDNRKTGANDRGLWGRGHYLASSPVSANSYALRQGDGARVIPAYVSIQNPLVLRTGSDLVTRLPDGTNTRELIGQNLDGSKIKSIAINGGHDGVIQIKPNGSIGDVVAFQPEQIKSAIGNNGQFDGTNPDIRYSLNLESEGDAGKAQAFFDPKTKTIFLIADNIEAGTEGAVLAHELMHKYGKEVLGEAGWSRLHSVIGTWATAKEGTQEREVYDQASEAVSRVGVELSTEELFPYAVEFAMKMGIKPDMAAGRGTVARWLESVRQNLKTVWDKITGKPETFKAQDLVNLAFGIAQMENNPEVTIREQTETPAFKKWFGNSKVVDANGKPLVVYHGTSKQVEFNEFKPSAAGVIYFTRKKEYANQMSKRRMVIDPMTADDYVGQVIPVYLNIKTPAFLSSAQMEDVGYSPSFVAQLKAAGHDGAVSKDGQIIVFDPTQIKSAIGNNGNFDPTNPDIRFARGDGMDAFRASLSKLSDPLPATDPKVIAKVQAWTDELSAKWENGPSIRVVSSFNDLPVPSTSDTRGLYYRGTVYVVASRVGSKRAVGEVLAHESVAHYGLREMLGKDDWQRFMGNIQLAIKSGNKPLNAIRDQIRSVYVDENGKPNLTPDQEADEIAARVVEKAIDANGEFKPGFAFVKSVYAKIAQFLRDMGLNVQMTHLELQGALINAQRYLEIGNRSSGGGQMVVAAAREDAQAARNDQTQTPEFKRWFGDSKVVDANGKPLVVYHGTSADFSTFYNAQSGIAGWFSPDARLASKYAEHAGGMEGDGPTVMPVYLSIKNPLQLRGDMNDAARPSEVFVDGQNFALPDVPGGYSNAPRKMFRIINDPAFVDAAKRAGYDGFYAREAGRPTYASFSPTQVKSATGNNGNFDPSNPDIRYARGEPTAPDSFGARLSRAPAPQVPPQVQNQWQKLKGKVNALTSPEKISNLIYEYQDKFIDLKNLRDHIKALGGTITDLNDAYLGEELYHKRVAKRTQDFLTDELKPLLADMRNRGVGLAKLEEFLHARHAPEANKEMAERNPTQAMIDAGTDAADADIKALELQLQKAIAKGTATRPIEDALNIAREARAKWIGAQAFRGTEEERTSLSGMSDAQAQAFMDNLSPGERLHMEALAVRVDAINAKTIDALARYGLMDRQSLAAWQSAYKYYVPLHRDEAHPDSVSHPIGQGFSTKGDASKRRTGSNAKVTNILAHIAMQRESALTRGEKNTVVKKLYLMAAQNPDPEYWSIDKPPTIKTVDKKTGFVRSGIDPMFKNRPNVVMLRVAGKDVAITFNEHNPQAVRLALAIKNQDVGDMSVVTTLAGKGTRWLASVNTQYNPVFGLFNFARDVQAAILQLSTTPLRGHEKDVAANMPAALKGIYSEVRNRRNGGAIGTSDWAKLWEEMQDMGGTTGYRDLFANPEDRVKALTSELAVLDRGNASKAAHAIVDWLSDYNEVMENATRLAAYRVALDQGMSKERAASLAKNLTVNFNRKGRQTSTVGAYYAFLNAAIQGTTRMVETLRGPAGKKIVLGGVMLGMANTMLGIAIMGGDGGDEEDNWGKIPSFVKERSLIVPLGKADYIAIPLPLGFNMLPNIGRKAIEMMAHKDPSKGAGAHVAELLGMLFNAFNPLGGAPDLSLESAIGVAAPTVVDPVYALIANRDWTGKTIYREDNNKLDPTPGHKRTKDSATPWGKGISEALNKITGGSDYRPGAVSWTPDQIDYVIGQLTGGVGREAGKIAQTLQAPFTADELPVTKVPLFGRIYGNTRSPSSNSEAYYKNVRELNEIENEVKGRSRDGKDVRAYRQEEPLTGVIGTGNAAESQIKRLRQIRSQIVKAEQPGYQEKAKAIDEKIGEVMRRLNNEVKRVQRDSNK